MTPHARRRVSRRARRVASRARRNDLAAAFRQDRAVFHAAQARRARFSGADSSAALRRRRRAYHPGAAKSDDIVGRWKESSPRGAASFAAIVPPCRSKSPASARSAAPAVTPTATSIWAATSRCGRSATTRARSSSIGSSRLIDEHKPLHVSIVGGEPLVRFRELNEILPTLAGRGIYTQVVTSAVRPIPIEWASDSAAADRRLDRRPAARARRAAQAGHLRSDPQAHRRAADHGALHGHPAAGAARRLSRGVRPHFWSANPHVQQIWVSLYTPQIGEVSPERLTPDDRERVVAALMTLRRGIPSCGCPKG